MNSWNHCKWTVRKILLPINLRQSCRIVKRIPKGARMMVATQYSKSIDRCIKTNTFSSWQELLTIPFKLLNLSSCNNNERKSIVRLIKDNCLNFVSEENIIENETVDIKCAPKIQSKSNPNWAKIVESNQQLLNKHPSPTR